MKRYPYDIRLILMAGILSSLALIVFPKGPLHLILDCLVIVLLGSGIVLMYLRKTGRSNVSVRVWPYRHKRLRGRRSPCERRDRSWV